MPARPLTPLPIPARIADASVRFGPILVLAVLPFAIPFRLEAPVVGQRFFFEIASLSLLSIWLLCSSIAPVSIRPFDFCAFFVLLEAVFVLASALASNDRSASLDRSILGFAGAGSFFLLRARGMTRPLFPPIALLLTCQAGVLSLYGIAQRCGFEILPYEGAFQKNRVVATLGHPNFFGSFAGPIVFLAAASAVGARRKTIRIIAAGSAILTASALFFARAHAAWLGFAAGALVVVILVLIRAARDGAGQRTVRGKMARLALGALMVLVLIAIPAISHFESLRPVPRGANLESRIYYWRIAAELHPASSLVGAGAGGFARDYWSLLDRHQSSEEGRLFVRNLGAMIGKDQRALAPGNVHDDYLEIWAEAGPIALFAHLALAAYLVLHAARDLLRRSSLPPEGFSNWLPKTLLLAAFVSMLIDAALGFPLALPASLALFWCLAAMLDRQIREGGV